MKSNLFNHYVDVFCKKFLGYCVFLSATDFQNNGSGQYVFDFKNRIYKFDSEPQPKLRVALEIQAWFDDMLRKDGCPIEAVETAILRVQCKAPPNSHLPSSQGTFEFTCSAEIKYQNKVFEKTMQEENTGLSLVSS